jgi:tol-pal system protein YbgF
VPFARGTQLCFARAFVVAGGLALPLVFGALAPAVLGGCAGTAEERQLADMRAEIDRIQDRRDRDDQATLPVEAMTSEPGATSPSISPLSPRAPTAAPFAQPMPADQDAVTLGSDGAGSAAFGPGGEPMADDAPDTEDPTPRPNIRVFGSARTIRGSWREDQVDQTSPDDPPRPAGSLDPAAAPAYDAAMALFNARQYDRALDAFASFLVRWPDHPYANNAMFWRGECYFAKGDYSRAADQFEGVTARFPAGSKVPDALLKLGMSRQKLGEPVKAKEAFDRLTQLFPQSDAARRIPVVTISATTPRGPASEDHR